MAKNKKSFILYTDQISIIEKLPDEKAGQLIKLIFQYVNDKNPVVDDLLLQVAFEPIKLQLKRDLKFWDKAKESKKIAGVIGNLKRYSPDLHKRYLDGEDLETLLNLAKARKTSHCDSLRSHSIAKLAVNDNVTVNVNDINTDTPTPVKWKTKPSENEMSLELPDITSGAVIQQFRFTKNKKVTPEQVTGLWNVFKAQNFNGEKFYQSTKQVYSHFINWCKTQEIKDTDAITESNYQPNVRLQRI